MDSVLLLVTPGFYPVGALGKIPPQAVAAARARASWVLAQCIKKPLEMTYRRLKRRQPRPAPADASRWAGPRRNASSLRRLRRLLACCPKFEA